MRVVWTAEDDFLTPNPNYDIANLRRSITSDDNLILGHCHIAKGVPHLVKAIKAGRGCLVCVAQTCQPGRKANPFVG